MAEETKKSQLLILTKTGGWADDDFDDEHENQESSTKSKAWETIDKPNVVPIGTDFELPGAKEQQQQPTQREFHQDRVFRDRDNRDDSRQGFRSRGGRDYRDDSRQGRFSSSRGGRGGFQNKFGSGDRRQNGYDRKPFDNEPRWGSRNQDDKKRRPLQLEPRTVNDGKSQVSTPLGVKESPFGNATPVTPKEQTTTTTTTTSEVSETRKTESPFGNATPVVPKAKETETTTNVEKSTPRETPSWRTSSGDRSQSRRDNKSDYKPRKFQGSSSSSSSTRKGDNGNPFKSGRKDRYNNNRKKDSDSWNEVKSSYDGSRRQQQQQTTTNVKTSTEPKDDQNTKNSFAILEDISD